MILRRSTRAVVLRSCLILATAVSPRRADAQSLGLAPAEVRASFTSGQPLRFELTVSNDAETPVVMKASVLDLWFNDRNEKVFAPPGSQPRSAANWIEFVPRDFTVPAGGTGKLNVLVTPPKEASGGYYAVLFVESTPRLAQAATPESRPVFTSMRLGALVLLNSRGTDTYDIEVGDPRLDIPAPDRPFAVDLELTNKSNTHIFPQLKVAILSSTRQLVAKTESEPKRFFPSQRDRIGVSWAGTLAPGRYVAMLTMVYGNDQVYTREVPFTVSTSDQSPTADAIR